VGKVDLNFSRQLQGWPSFWRARQRRVAWATRLIFWPDPGLYRNTRCRCYRCSVPGLAGFTRLALCGARDL